MNFPPQINIDKGLPSTHRFTFASEGDHDPGKEQGDIIIQLEEKPHDYLQRHGQDMSMKMDLSLCEALCGFKIPIETLDKRTVVISAAPGEVLNHGVMKMVEEEGFPKHRDPFNKGRLIIVFNVAFPESLTADQAKRIGQALAKVPSPTRAQIPDDAEAVSLKDFDGKGEWKGGEQEEPMEADNEGPGPRMGQGGGPQCAQQ